MLLYGEERYLQTQFLADLKGRSKRRFRRIRHRALRRGTRRNARLVAGGRLVTDVLDECRSMGLLAAHKLVLVENADIMLKDKSEDESGAAGGEFRRRNSDAGGAWSPMTARG